MSFKVGKFYTHRRMLDSVIEVKRLLPSGSMTIKWWNKSGLDLFLWDTVYVKEEQKENWYECWKK